MKKLKKILLINWLYFSKELIEVGDINFLTGKNGAGKSTVIDALQIVLLGETNARNFNQAASEKSQRTLDSYLRADMDENNPYSRRGKDFSTYIACEFQDETEGSSFVTGVVFDCHSDGSRRDSFFLYIGTLPENCFIQQNEAMDTSALRQFLNENENYSEVKICDTQKKYRNEMLAKWNVHNEQVLRMMKKAISFRPIVDIQKFITENICDIPEKPNIELMQQNIRDYKRHELLAQRQQEKLDALQQICKLHQEMNQNIDLWRVQSFLVQWAEKELAQAAIDQTELEKQKCMDELAAVRQHIEALTQQIAQKDARRRDLELSCSQSSVFQEEERLLNAKRLLQAEQQKLCQGIGNLALEIKREALRLKKLCETVLDWDAEELLRPVQEAADAVQKAYAPFMGGELEMFSQPAALFETAQEATAAFDETVRTVTHKIEDRTAILKAQIDQKGAALANLRKNIKDYPKGLVSSQKRIQEELYRKAGCSVPVYILADLLEISDERWRGAVEGYLNNQKFYFLVEPAHYQEALRIYDRLKRDPGFHAYGLVDIRKLREKETICASEDSLAGKIETNNDLARSYVDYLLGRVICCDTVEQLRSYKTAITADGMLYQGYVARALRQDRMEDAFIGQHAVKLRIERLEQELTQLDEELRHWTPMYQRLSNQKDFLFTRRFVESDVAGRQGDYLRNLTIKKEVAELEEQLAQLDLLWLSEQRKIIDSLQAEIVALSKERDAEIKQNGRIEGHIRQLDDIDLPKCHRDYAAAENRLNETFSVDYQEKIGIPRYQQEFSRLKRADTIRKNFNDSLARTTNAREASEKALFAARRAYVDTFKPCSFSIEALDNDEFEAERQVLEESELPKYRKKIAAARESALEQFQNDFLAKLKSSIDQVKNQVTSLNRALQQAQFGTDRYQFRVDRNPDYADYYDMIMAPELM